MSENTKVTTIGFTEKSAERFFELLISAGVRTLIDVRLNNTSQLAGFAKKGDLKYFLKSIADIAYVEAPELAPEGRLLKDYRNKVIDWDYYENKYIETLGKRNVEKKMDKTLIGDACLLCSEHLPHQCHRRVALEYLQRQWGESFITKHLV